MEKTYKDCERCGDRVDVSEYPALAVKMLVGLLCPRCTRVTAWDGGTYVKYDY